MKHQRIHESQKSNENKEGDFIRDSQMMKSQSINTAETS